ncbi:MAG: class I SAM-dependent methyltransferase [Methanomicrobiales archaeon]|nr:class I SAM-dependent methyltransferase [Methanomicrobiales archaeon]
MPPIFWTGRLSPTTKLMVNISNLFAWVTGNARDTVAMKGRVKLGYEGTCSDQVTRYDTVGIKHYTKIAAELLEGIDLKGKYVLDVGCGTGILTLSALSRGASKLICADFAKYMLEQCRKKAAIEGYAEDRVDFRQVDAESLPFESHSFDAVISSMMLGMAPEQRRVLAEMNRVVKPGEIVALSAHGTEHNYEAAEVMFKTIPLRYVFGYRIEFWPHDEKEVKQMFLDTGYVNVRTRRLTWQDVFPDGGKAYDFFASTTSSWWVSKLPPSKVAEVFHRGREAFKRKNVTQITQDVILAYGQKKN